MRPGMSDMVDGKGRYRCARCTMSYVIGETPQRAAISRCRECHLLFWHQGKFHNRIEVGITPHELLQQSPEGVA